MINTQIKINTPIWNGRKVGLARHKLTGEKVNIIIEYRNKSGRLEFPHVYEISCRKARTYPVQKIRGVEVHVIPIADLESVAVREEMQLWQT